MQHSLHSYHALLPAVLVADSELMHKALFNPDRDSSDCEAHE